MAWMQKLNETYDAVMNCVNLPGRQTLVPLGFARKKAAVEVILSQKGEFIDAVPFEKEDSAVIVPSSPEAEGRTGASGEPYPLCEQLDYVSKKDDGSVRYQSYIDNLLKWCSDGDAPACLSAVADYLQTGTIKADILSKNPKLKLSAGDIVCFSVQEEGCNTRRLWEREDVRKSWEKRLISHISGLDNSLCYIEGKMLPALWNHPKVRGNAKLISAKDANMSFQYKGRFTDQKQANTVSYEVSARAHNTLAWLVNRQGFDRYGLTIVAWNTNGCPVKVPVRDSPDEDDDILDAPTGALSDTFEAYGTAVAKMAAGYREQLEKFDSNRVNQIVIMGMEAATTGRMSITYYQEISGGDFVKCLQDWYQSCAWLFLRPDGMGKRHLAVWTPSPLTISRAVLGARAVETARTDMKCDKSATKQMRALRLRLLDCVINGKALPVDIVNAAFSRASTPLGFVNKTGGWDYWAWRETLAATCAMIRRRQWDTGEATTDARLDVGYAQRDYLYGRMMGVADWMEWKAAEGDDSRATNAVRLMRRYVNRPFDTWPELHNKLLPYIAKPGVPADRFRLVLGDIESLFNTDDRLSHSPLGQQFLVGYFCQRQAMFSEDKKASYFEYTLPSDRAELYGCILAVADYIERLSTGKNADTSALRITERFVSCPFDTWPKLHDRMLPYIEKLGGGADDLLTLIGLIEKRFSLEDRQSTKPLSGNWLHGYYCISKALNKGRIVRDESGAGFPIEGRDGLYGELLGIADRIERWAMSGEEERTTNAMRFMTVFARRPEALWPFLRKKLKPYEKRIGPKSGGLIARMDKIEERLKKIEISASPLDGMYLNAYYRTRS